MPLALTPLRSLMRDELVDYMRLTGSAPTEACKQIRKDPRFRGEDIDTKTAYNWAAQAGVYEERKAAGGAKELAKKLREAKGLVLMSPLAEEHAEAAEERAKTKRAPVTLACDLPTADREDLRRAARLLLAKLAGRDPETGMIEAVPSWWGDPKQAADAVRALDGLLARTPDILTFDEKTNGEAATSEGSDDEAAEKVREAIGA